MAVLILLAFDSGMLVGVLMGIVVARQAGVSRRLRWLEERLGRR